MTESHLAIHSSSSHWSVLQAQATKLATASADKFIHAPARQPDYGAGGAFGSSGRRVCRRDFARRSGRGRGVDDGQPLEPGAVFPLVLPEGVPESPERALGTDEVDV